MTLNKIFLGCEKTYKHRRHNLKTRLAVLKQFCLESEPRKLIPKILFAAQQQFLEVLSCFNDCIAMDKKVKLYLLQKATHSIIVSSFINSRLSTTQQSNKCVLKFNKIPQIAISKK